MWAAARGELGPLGRLYSVYAPGLTKAAEEILEDPSSAPDIVQDVFVRLCGRAGQFDPARGTVWLWLTTITRHACVDHNRSMRRLRRARRTMIPGSATTTEDAIDVFALRTIRRRLSSLCGSHRRTVEVAFWQDASYPEIAAREGVSLNTVKSRGSRALQALRSDFDRLDLIIDVPVRGGSRQLSEAASSPSPM